MTIEAYINPDFTWPKKLIFFLVALLAIVIGNLLILAWNSIAEPGKGRGAQRRRKDNYYRMSEYFYELIISATSVMSFACAYVVLNHVYSLYHGSNHGGMLGTFLYGWENWKDFILLLMICLSCVLNTLLDKFLIPIKGLSRDQIASVRMLGMFYTIVVLLYLNFIGDESEYSPVMMYYLGLMVGRFVYFDASFLDFLDCMKRTIVRTPLLVLGLTISGGMSFFGFAAGYLLERNYYIVGVFYTHLFLLAAVFVLHHGRQIYHLIRKKKSGDPGRQRGCEEYDDSDEYTDFD